MALTKIKDWNPTDQGRVAQVVVWGVRGNDGEAYVMNVDPVSGGFPIDVGASDLASESTLDDIKTLVTTIEDNTDGIEASLAAIEGYIDGIETAIAATNTRLGEMPAGLITAKHDSITPTFNATSDVWEYKLVGVTQQTLTVNYVDATKQVISSVVRT
jgi:hypothetical protein